MSVLAGRVPGRCRRLPGEGVIKLPDVLHISITHRRDATPRNRCCDRFGTLPRCLRRGRFIAACALFGVCTVQAPNDDPNWRVEPDSSYRVSTTSTYPTHSLLHLQCWVTMPPEASPRVQRCITTALDCSIAMPVELPRDAAPTIEGERTPLTEAAVTRGCGIARQLPSDREPHGLAASVEIELWVLGVGLADR